MSGNLFGPRWADELQDSIADVWETEFEGGAEIGEEFEVVEWTSTPASMFAIGDIEQYARNVAEDIAEAMADDVGFERVYDELSAGAESDEVVAAFSEAIRKLGATCKYRLAQDEVATHTITVGSDGEPLLRGKPLYVRRAVARKPVKHERIDDGTMWRASELGDQS